MTDRELMQQALEKLEFFAHMKGVSEDTARLIAALRERLAQPEPVTGNILKDAYNAMVEKKTRSQKLREAGFTRRPKGWEKEKDEQEPVAHTLNCVCGAVWDVRSDGVEEMVHAPTTPQRTWVGLTEEELYEIYDESDDGSSPCGVCGACSKCKIEVAIARAIEARIKEKNNG